MAKTIKVNTLAKWVYIDDDETVVEVASPSAAPKGATLFKLRSMPVDSLVCWQIASNNRDRVQALSEGGRRAVAEIRGLVDQNDKPLVVGQDDICEFLQGMPINDQVALGNYIQGQFTKQLSEINEARRGNAPSGTSRTKKSSSGARRTAGPRTVSPATN